jgi:hypothetical protein
MEFIAFGLRDGFMHIFDGDTGERYYYIIFGAPD